MLYQLLIGLLAILYGAINLGVNISLKVFWCGLIVFGIVYLYERFEKPIRARLARGQSAE